MVTGILKAKVGAKAEDAKETVEELQKKVDELQDKIKARMQGK